jgi:hypothetical protein
MKNNITSSLSTEGLDDEDLHPKQKLNESECKNAIKVARQEYKTMANALVASYKSKAVESLYSNEGKTINNSQKLFLILLALLTNVTLLPWLIVWWLMIGSNGKSLTMVTQLIEVEMPSTMINYKNTEDEKLRWKLKNLFKHQFKKTTKLLAKLTDITDYSQAIERLKTSKQYQNAINFNAKVIKAL